MREILFRGKTKDGRWVYGDLVRRLVDTTWQDILGEYQFAIAGKGEREKTVDFKNKRAEVISCTTVDPATVGQFTGLCDDKGRKVFEGDIIDVRGRFKSEVRYISRNAGYLIKDNYGWRWLYDVLASMPCEVIGNIHDTPALVKEESE